MTSRSTAPRTAVFALSTLTLSVLAAGSVNAQMPVDSTASFLAASSPMQPISPVHRAVRPDPRRWEGEHDPDNQRRRPASAQVSGQTPALNSGPIDAYGEYRAVSPGNRVYFSVSDNLATNGQRRPVKATAERLAPTPEKLGTRTISARMQPVPDQPWEQCCNWPSELDFTIPWNWKSGIYQITFENVEGNTTTVPFIVRSAWPGATSSIAVQVPFDTNQAYNNWGGKSLYDYSSTDGVRASRVSTRRPRSVESIDDIVRWVVPYALWAEKNGIALEFISGMDLEVNPSLLNAYRLLNIVGHDEYWTEGMRTAVEQFTDRGGNLAIFGGNTMWWRTKWENDRFGRQTGLLVCTKTPGTDTDLWYTYRPEAAVIGDTFLTGGWVSESTQEPLTHGSYTVWQPDSWVFAGTGLTRGSTFGGDQGILRYEVDGVYWTNDPDGIPVSAGAYGAPSNLQLLAMYPLPEGWVINGDKPNAAVSMFTKPSGATVFNAGTTDWVRALPSCTASGKNDNPVCQITKNVLTKLMVGAR